MKGSAQAAVQLPDLDDAPIRPESPLGRGAAKRSRASVRPLAFPGPSVPPPPVAVGAGVEMSNLAGGAEMAVARYPHLRSVEWRGTAAPGRPGARGHIGRWLVVGDGLALAAGLLVAGLLDAGSRLTPGAAVLAGAVTLLAGIGLAAFYGLYGRDDERADHATADDVASVLHVTVIMAWLVALALWLSGTSLDRGPVLILWAASFGLMLISRATVRGVYRRRAGYMQNTIIVGAGSVGQLLADKLTSRSVHGMNLVGFVDDERPDLESGLAHVPVLGPVADLPALIRRHAVERVIVAFSVHSHERTMELLRSLKDVEVQVDVVPRLFDALGPGADIHTLDGLPLIAQPKARRSEGSVVLKRALDLILAGLGVVFLAPALSVIALLVKLDSPGPCLYRGKRVGQDGVPFMQLKFRTMHTNLCSGEGFGGEDADAAFARLLAERDDLREEFERTHKLSHDPRVTRVGRILRATSLDELPQLFNVLRGELSLVGPRPVTADELSRYGENVTELLSVPPGLTGYWQISGRSALRYDERVRLDLAYVRSWSVKLDLLILLKTSKLLTAKAGAV
jgi:exopolysaccharide biosynthesis polyprenyl glycosylphosphotransferase